MGSRARRVRTLQRIRERASSGGALPAVTVGKLLDRTAAALGELEDLEAVGIQDLHLRRCMAYLLGDLDDDLSGPQPESSRSTRSSQDVCGLAAGREA